MSQDESLRLVAEVKDKFTGPLGALKKQMENLAREGGVHTDTLSKGFGRLESSAQAAEKAISSGLKPAFGVVGVTGLSVAAAITGIAASMRSFAAGAASLGALSRETGQTADNLRNFGAVASKFGIDQDAVAAGTRNFAGQMREFGRGIGETYQWLNRQGRDAAGRQHFQDFAADLRNTTDRGEQLRKVLREMENIQDPTERGMFAEKFFGSTDFGRLGDKHFGPILEMWKKTAQKLGPLDPAAVKSAEDFERTMSELRTSMQKLGTTVGQEVLPYASQFTTWLSDIVGGQRNDAIKAIREGIGEIRKELDAIDWKGAGAQAKEFLTGTITFAGDLVKALKAAALLLGALKDLKDGNIGEAFKKLGQADKATDLGLGQGRAPGTIQDSMRADTGPMMLRQAEIQRQIAILDESIARKESQPDPTGEGRAVDAEGRARRDRLIDETRKLADEIRRLREDPAKRSPTGEATAQPSSFGGGGTGLGGLIHRASLGGLAGAAQAGRVLGGGAGIVLPGGGGLPSGGGDKLFGRDPGSGSTSESGPAAAGRKLRGGGSTSARGSLAANQQEAYAAARAEGLSDTAARALVANMTGESLRNPRDHHWDYSHMSQGIVQWDPQRADRIRQRFGAYPKDMSVTDQTRAAIDEMKTRPEYAPTWRALQGDQPGLMLDALVRNYERPKFKERAIAERSAFYRGFSPKPFGTADGAGFSADFKARQTAEEARRSGLKLGAGAQGALQAGAGAGSVTADGRVNIAVHTKDPDTKVNTSASGNLFREIVQTRGRQMQPAAEP